jgi:hypothetical protein
MIVVLIMIMRCCGSDDMLFCYIYIDKVLLTGFPECAGLWTFEDVDGIDGSPWTLDRVREWTVMV